MTKFKVEKPTVEKVSFVMSNYRKCLVYAEYGIIKTYSNKKQAQGAVDKLTVLGHNVGYSLSHPYVIMLQS